MFGPKIKVDSKPPPSIPQVANGQQPEIVQNLYLLCFCLFFSTKQIFTHIFVPTLTFCGKFFLHFQLKVRQQFASPWTPSHYWWSPHSPSSLPTPPSLLLILYFHWFLPFHSLLHCYHFYCFPLYVILFYRTRVRSLGMLVTNSLTH